MSPHFVGTNLLTVRASGACFLDGANLLTVTHEYLLLGAIRFRIRWEPVAGITWDLSLISDLYGSFSLTIVCDHYFDRVSGVITDGTPYNATDDAV